MAHACTRTGSKGEAHYVGEVLDVDKIGIVQREKPGAEPSFRVHYPADADWVNAGPKGVKYPAGVDATTGEVTNA